MQTEFVFHLLLSEKMTSLTVFISYLSGFYQYVVKDILPGILRYGGFRLL